MNTNGQVITKVFNDKNINKDERYMFLMFISMIEDLQEEISISITTLMDIFQTKCKKKVLDILKSLENKGYIEIIKSVGKTNKYRVIKNYLNAIVNNFDHDNKESQYSVENHYAGDFYSKNTSSNGEPGNGITSGNLDTGSNITTANNDTGSYIELVSNEYDKYSEYKVNSGFEGDTYASNNNKYNNIYINKNNKLYINIFNAWNETGISNEKILYKPIKSAIEYAVNIYGEDNIITAIKNYSEVYHSNHYYDYSWTLASFLRKENGVKRFLNDGDIWCNYNFKVKKQNQEEKFNINIEDYID